MRTLARFTIVAASAMAAACNPVANIHGGEAQIAQFHEVYGNGNADALYALTGPQLRHATSLKDFEQFFNLVQARLGAIKSSTRQGFNVSSSTANGTVTTVVMDTSFAKGEATETFTFLGSGDDMALAGWRVNSDKLLATPEDIARDRQDQARDRASPAPTT